VQEPRHVRIDVSAVTPQTAPPYVLMSYAERNSQYVLTGKQGRVLVGPLGVEYVTESTSLEAIQLRRVDVPSFGRAMASWRAQLSEDGRP
jgi:hypothetical protein